MSMYDTLAPRPIRSDADGFADLMRRVDRAEPWRAGASASRELGFNEELRFDEPRGRRKRAGKTSRVQAKPAAAPKRGPELRLVVANGTDESVAVEDARMHARNESLSWKEYVENMDRFLCLQLEATG